MLFSSSIFLFLFLPLVLLGYYGLCSWFGRFQYFAKNLLLLGASIFFYAWGEPWFILILLCSILANHGLGLWVARQKANGNSSRAPIICAVVYNLGILFVFKYLVFVLSQINGLGATIPIPNITLPLGLGLV